jgi:subtilisin family serine protease
MSRLSVFLLLGFFSFGFFSFGFLQAQENILLVKTRRQVGFGVLSSSQLEQTLNQYKATVNRSISIPPKNQRSLSAIASDPDKILVVNTTPETHALIRTKLRQLSDVEWAEELHPLNLFSETGPIPSDPRYPAQHYIADTMLNFLLRMPIRRSVRVAIIDSGIDYTHEDLFGNIWKNPQELPNNIDDDNNGLIDDIWGYNFYGAYKGEDTNNPIDVAGHGTHIAGIIAGGVDNKTGITGLNPSLELLNLRFTSDTGAGNQLDAALAIRYAIQKQVDIIVCAWGYYVANTVLKEAIEDALAHGIIVVAAMGNSGSDRIEFPAGLPGVIAVGAVSSTGEWASFSSYGDHVQFVAFGVDILSTLPNNRYGTQSGTSQSAAIMAGTIARMLAAQPQLTRNQINTHLLLAADPIIYPQKNQYTGYGILNPETLFKTLNVSPESSILKSGWQAAVITPTPPLKSEDLWISLLLFPLRLIEGVWRWLI